MEIGNFSLGNSEIGNCSYENPHVSFSNGDELSFCFYGIDQAAFLFTFIKKGDRKTWYQIDFKTLPFLIVGTNKNVHRWSSPMNIFGT